MELSHAGLGTQANPRLPGKPEALPGVGSDSVSPINLAFSFHLVTDDSEISHNQYTDKVAERRQALSQPNPLCARRPTSGHRQSQTPLDRVCPHQRLSLHLPGSED